MESTQKKKTQRLARKRDLVGSKTQPEPEFAPTPSSPVAPPEPESKGDGHPLPLLDLPGGAATTTVAAPPLALTPRSLLNAISLEAGLYSMLFAAALVTRFAGLGARPLAEHEAAVANAAWQFLQGTPNGYIGSPFLFSTNALLFFLGGPSDATVRLVPAIIGSGLVMLPVLLRRELGRTGAFVSSLLLLLSTSLVYFSRDANGAEIAVATGLSAAIALWRYRERKIRLYLYGGVVAPAIALTASPVAFTILVAGVAFALFGRRFGTPRDRIPADQAVGSNGHTGEEAGNTSDIPRNEMWRAILLFSAVYVGIATTFMSNREGLGAAFELFGIWLKGLSSLGSFASPLNLLPLYEPAALVFGFAGLLLLVSIRGQDLVSHGVLLLFAFVLVIATIYYSLSGDKSPENIVVLAVPLAVLAGWLIGALVERFIQDIQDVVGWRAAALGELPVFAMGIALIALVYVQLVTLLQSSRFSPNLEALRELVSAAQNPGEFATALILLGIFTIALGSLIFLLAIVTLGSTRAANLASLFIVLLLAISGVRALWLANFTTAQPLNELLAGPQTSLQARDLAQDLEWLSEWRDSDPHVLPIQADENLGPVAHWYLRGFKNVQWVRQPQAVPVAEAVLTAADAPAPIGAWIDQRYRLETRWTPAHLTGDLFWKWLVFRDGGDQAWQYVKLWAPKPE